MTLTVEELQDALGDAEASLSAEIERAKSAEESLHKYGFMRVNGVWKPKFTSNGERLWPEDLETLLVTDGSVARITEAWRNDLNQMQRAEEGMDIALMALRDLLKANVHSAREVAREVVGILSDDKRVDTAVDLLYDMRRAVKREDTFWRGNQKLLERVDAFFGVKYEGGR